MERRDSMGRNNGMFDKKISQKVHKTLKESYPNWGLWNKGRKRPDLTTRNLKNNPMKNLDSINKMKFKKKGLRLWMNRTHPSLGKKTIKIPNKICETCNKEYYVRRGRINKSKYCSVDCFNKDNSIKNKGIKRDYFKRPSWMPPHNKGKTKENYEPMIKMSLKRKQMFKDGTLIHPRGMLGKKHTINNVNKHKEMMVKKWQNKDFKDRVRKIILKSLIKRPTKTESQLNKILQQNFPNDWKYVGNGEVMIDGKNPDFMNINGKKLIIEMFGDVYHNPKNAFFNVSYNRTEEGTIAHYQKYGYKTLIIWESELKNLTENQIVDKIKKFDGGY